VRLLDLFSGIGGFSNGLVQAGMELVGYCEIDKYAHQAFQILHDPEERLWNAYDVRTIDPFRLPEFDCVCFGWPCQDNSIAGKRKGQLKRDESNEGNRSGLLFEATRIIRARKPKYFIAENVEGLFSVNDGRDFYATIREFTDMGYDVQWQVLNSSAYVPQNRKRIFFVGHLRGTRRPEVFPFGCENENAIEVIGKLEGNHDQNSRIYGISGISPTLSTMQGGGQEPKVLVNIVNGELKQREDFTCLDANYAKGLDNHGARTGVMVKEITCVNPRKEDGTQTYQQDRVYDTDGVMTTLSAELAGRFNILEPIAVLTPDREEKRQNGRRFKEPGEPMFTLTAQDKHGVAIIDDQGRTKKELRLLDTCPTLRAQSHGNEPKVVIVDDTQGFDGVRTYDEALTLRAQRSGLKVTDGYRIRKLTPLECFRLQSFPDWWYYKLKEHGISDSQLYKMAGNAVTSEVARQIGIRLMAGG
jgi:DNA (cytosine-5)-methyltransferase 1